MSPPWRRGAAQALEERRVLEKRHFESLGLSNVVGLANPAQSVGAPGHFVGEGRTEGERADAQREVARIDGIGKIAHLLEAAHVVENVGDAQIEQAIGKT